MSICVIIPTFNSPFIHDVLEDLLKYNYKIIVVDDGSSIPITTNLSNIEVLTHSNNLGKGEAILTGALRAKELGYSFFVTMDADKQHLSSEIEKLVHSYQDSSIVIGNRNFNHPNVPNNSKFGRKFSNFWVKLETFKNLGDTQSGFRIYPTSILDLNIKNKRFDFEIEVLVLHSYKDRDIIDIDVECYYPPVEERVSHFDKIKDNTRLSILHSKLIMQRYLLLKGFIW